jgi:cation transport ATPase
MILQEKTARIIVECMEIETPVEDVKVDDLVVMHPVEKLPADGVVTEDVSAVDAAIVIWESMPVWASISNRRNHKDSLGKASRPNIRLRGMPQ